MRRERPDEQRCTALNPNGERCRRERWPGTDTCPAHDPDPDVRARYRAIMRVCTETTVAGARCTQAARIGEDTCWRHDPAFRCTGRISGGTDHKDRAGERCRNRAIEGGTVCEHHGGAAPQVREAAAFNVFAKEARALMATYGEKLDITPENALIAVVQWTAGHVEWLRARVQEIQEAHAESLFDPDGTERAARGRHPLVWGITKIKDGGDDQGVTEEAAASMWLKLYTQERELLIKASATAIRAGVDERLVRIAETTGARVADVIQAILGDLELTPQQWTRVRDVVPARLRELTA